MENKDASAIYQCQSVSITDRWYLFINDGFKCRPYYFVPNGCLVWSGYVIFDIIEDAMFCQFAMNFFCVIQAFLFILL